MVVLKQEIETFNVMRQKLIKSANDESSAKKITEMFCLITEKKYPSTQDIDNIVEFYTTFDLSEELYYFVGHSLRVWWTRGFESSLCRRLCKRATERDIQYLLYCVFEFNTQIPECDLNRCVPFDALIPCNDHALYTFYQNHQEVFKDLVTYSAPTDEIFNKVNNYGWDKFCKVVDGMCNKRGTNYLRFSVKSGYRTSHRAFAYALFAFQRADLVEKVLSNENFISIFTSSLDYKPFKWITLLNDMEKRNSIFDSILEKSLVAKSTNENDANKFAYKAKKTFFTALIKKNLPLPPKFAHLSDGAHGFDFLSLYALTQNGNLEALKKLALGRIYNFVSKLITIAIKRRQYHIVNWLDGLMRTEWNVKFDWAKLENKKGLSPEAQKVIRFYRKDKMRLCAPFNFQFGKLKIEWTSPEGGMIEPVS